MIALIFFVQLSNNLVHPLGALVYLRFQAFDAQESVLNVQLLGIVNAMCHCARCLIPCKTEKPCRAYWRSLDK